MAIKYISSAADGTRDGSQATNGGAGVGPWTIAQMFAATPAAGDEHRIMADGTYTRSATGTVAWANGTQAANIVITGANSSGTVDGTRPTIQLSGSTLTALNITGSHIRLDYLTVDGNSQTSSTGIVLGTSYVRARYCKALNCTTRGFQSSNFNQVCFIRCHATGCSGTAAFDVGSQGITCLFCEAYGNTTHGFRLSSSNSSLVGCISSGNTGASTDGFNQTSVGAWMERCVSYGNGRAGFDVTGNAGFGTYLSNCIAEANGGEGFRTDAVKSGAFLINCGGYNNTSGNYNATNLTNVDGFVNNTTGSFFTNAASGDFSLNNTTNQGALARAAGFPGLMPRGTTTGYLDIGAAQHADPAGGGGTTIAGTPLQRGMVS